MKLANLPVGTVIEFTDAIDDFGAYAEKGIRARVEAVEQHDWETLSVSFDYTEFAEHNRGAESAMYGSGANLKTASEAGVVPESEGLFFAIDAQASDFVKVVSLAPRPGPRP